MKVRSKLTNRLISFGYILIFIISLVVLGIGTSYLISLYKENKVLENIKNNLENSSSKNSKYEELHLDEYYNVFVSDGYSLSGDNNSSSIYYFTK